jgi:phytoene desaturase (3,4-didehydrolycopene-forming)
VLICSVALSPLLARFARSQVVQSLINIATTSSAKFHFSSPVSHVQVSPSGTATGIVLADGRTVDADLVVVNADLAWAHGNLFKAGGKEGQGQRDPKLAKRLEGKPHS